MKKTVVLLVLLVLCMAGALAEDHMPLILKPGVYELEYSVMEDGTVMVAQCWGIPVELEIPEQIDGRPVTAIRDGAFVNDYYLTCVDLPDTLVSIGEDAFANCINLKEIVLPDGLKKIGSGVFESCRMLESISGRTSRKSFGRIGPLHISMVYFLFAISRPSVMFVLLKGIISRKYGFCKKKLAFCLKCVPKLSA